jgi:hypothetical protein
MSNQKRAQTRRRDGARKPMTSGQLADLINGMPRKDRQSLAEDIEHIACGLRRFAKLVRR